VFNVPLLLTTVRLLISPFVLPILLIEFVPLHNALVNQLLTGLFVLLSMTDFLDGYLARKCKQETMLGKLLDPVADKCLIVSTAMSLLYLHKLFLYWPVLVIARDFFVMGLREVALSYGFSVPVIWGGKVKTAAQMVYLAVVLYTAHLETYGFIIQIGWWLGVISCGITLWTGGMYYHQFYKQYAKLQRSPQ